MWLPGALLRSRAFLVTASTITVALAILAASNPQWLARFDEPVSEWIRGDGTGEQLFRVVTQLGSPNLAVLVAAVGATAVWRRCRASALVLAALVSAAVTADVLLKLVIDRPRPSGSLVNTALGSFPSGHVMHAVTVFGFVPFLLWSVIGRRWVLRAGSAVFAAAVLTVAFSRVRLAAHWPSDVIVSFLIGVTLLAAAEQLVTSAWAAGRCRVPGLHPSSTSNARDT